MASPRNQPCRCGSGKKTKHCCGDEVALPASPASSFASDGELAGADGAVPWFAVFDLHDSAAVEKAFSTVRKHLIPVEVGKRREEPSWAWMARIHDAVSSAEVVFLDKYLVIIAPTEQAADACRQFTTPIVGSAATYRETFRRDAPPGGFDPRGRGYHPPATPYLHLVANIRHYLDNGDLSIRVPDKPRAIGLYIGQIASAASRREPGDQYYTGITCRRRPRNLACGSEIVAGIEADGRIEWQCPGCGDSGTITGWEETAFDARDRAAILARESYPEADVRVLILTSKNVRSLRALRHLDAPALRFLLSAQMQTDGKLQLVGTRSEMVSLARCIAFHFARADNLSASAENALHDLHGFMAQWGDAIPDLSQAAQCAEILLFERSRDHSPRPSSRDAKASCRLHVSLQHIEPPIWRRLDLPGDFTLADVSDALILAFGWADTHLHCFEHGGRTYALPRPDEYEPSIDERTVRLCDILPHAGARMIWEYDFGDCWRHEIVVEEVLTSAPSAAVPQLLAGARATPPEDCGGPPGYERLLEALRDPFHEDHDSLSEWSDDFEPEDFSLEKFGERISRMTDH